MASGQSREGLLASEKPGPTPQVQQERDGLYRKFTAAILEVQQKVGLKNLVLERKVQALAATVEKKEVQFNEVLAASNLDPAALTLVSRKLEVSPRGPRGGASGGLASGRGSCLVLQPPSLSGESQFTSGRGCCGLLARAPRPV